MNGIEIETSTPINPADVVLAEYKAIKDEQGKRIGMRDNLPYVTIAALATALVATTKLGTLVLLALPLACTVLGWTYLMNDMKVSQQGRCIREKIRPYVEANVPPGTPVFVWETFYRETEARRRARLRWQLAVDLATFCGSGLIALLAYWTRSPIAAVWLVVSIAEAVLVAGLAYRIVRLEASGW